jgi:TonB family protein
MSQRVVEPMYIPSDYYTRHRGAGSRLRRAVVVSALVHAAVLAGAGMTGYLWKSAPQTLGFQMEFLAKGLPNAPEGVETTRRANLPPGPPAVAPVPPEPQKEEQKPEEPKPEPEPEKKPEPPKPEPKKVEEKKPEPKKPEPKKEEPKKEEPKREAKKPDPPKKEEPKEPPKQEAKREKTPSLSDDLLDKMLEEDESEAEDINLAALDPDAAPGGGMEGARASTRAQTGYGSLDSSDTGISVKGVPGPLSTWANQVKRQVKRFWVEPMGVNVSNQCAISFWVARDGRLMGEPTIHQASNDAALDESALRAVRLAAPFPPLPPQFTGNEQQVIFIFTLSS